MMTTHITNKSGVRISYEQFARFIEHEVRRDFTHRELYPIGSWSNLADLVDVNEYIASAVTHFRIDMDNDATIYDTFKFMRNTIRATHWFLFNNNLDVKR
jgi:hypothetical protein